MARDFDGVDDFLQVANYGSPASFTIAMWIQPDTSNVSLNFIGKQSANFGFNGWRVGHASSSNLFINLNGDSLDVNLNSTTSDFTIGKWSWVVATLTDGSSTRGYVDGVKVIDADSQPNNISESNPLVIGWGYQSSTNNFFDGKIAHTHIYNRFLSVNEMDQLSRFPGSIQNGLLLYIPITGNSPEQDYSGTNKLATVSGGTTAFYNDPPVNGMFVVSKPRLEYSF